HDQVPCEADSRKDRNRQPDGAGAQGDPRRVALNVLEKEVTSDPSGLRPSNHWPLSSSHPTEKFARGDSRRQATFSSYLPVWRRTGLVSSPIDRKSTRLNSSHVAISYAVFCLKKKKNRQAQINLKS